VVQNIVTLHPLSYVGHGCLMVGMTITVQLTLGETLRLMRERAGFSQSQLAKYLEIGRTSVIRYEADTALPKWKDVQAWATICDHDADTLREAWVATSMSGCIYGSGPPPDGRYLQLSWAGGSHDSSDTPQVATSRSAA
jgi:DNA-binding XRE family transcriptional regulator